MACYLCSCSAWIPFLAALSYLLLNNSRYHCVLFKSTGGTGKSKRLCRLPFIPAFYQDHLCSKNISLISVPPCLELPKSLKHTSSRGHRESAASLVDSSYTEVLPPFIQTNSEDLVIGKRGGNGIAASGCLWCEVIPSVTSLANSIVSIATLQSCRRRISLEFFRCIVGKYFIVTK